VREWPGKSPLRMVIDRKLRLPAYLNLFDDSLCTLVFNESRDENVNRTRYVKLDFSRNILPQILEHLYHLNIQSLFIEGGRKLIESFITENLWDEARVFTGVKTFGSGIRAPDIPSIQPREYHIREDLLEIFFNE
jgi:diaminohydroxyphosphoribosylaminopyrimidine deaminase/5-amino-6-(5-phosphoribosylamino)uracil reductase